MKTLSPNRDIYKKIGLIGGFLFLVVIGFIAAREHLSFQALVDNREALIAFRDAHFVATVLVYALVYIVMVAFSLPGALIATLAGGFLFGLVFGTILTVFAATIGATLIFLAARFGFGDSLGARLQASDGVVKKIKKGIDENQWSMLFVMRLVPIVPFFVANLVPALVQVPTHRFVISTFFGIIPGTFVYTSVGAGLSEVIAAGEKPNFGLIFEPHVLIPMLGLAALSCLPVVIKAFSSKKDL